MSKSKIKHEADQGEFLTCGNCGRTWPDMDARAKMAERSRAPFCITCALLTTVMGHCEKEGISLKDATHRFLKGVERRTELTLRNVWEAKDPGFYIILGVKNERH